MQTPKELIMEYLINGTVIFLLFAFFTILSIESKSTNEWFPKLPFSDLIINFRGYWKQVIKR